MNIDEIRRNAPWGAEYYCTEPYIGYFCVSISGQWEEWDDREEYWNPLHFNPNKYRDIKPLN